MADVHTGAQALHALVAELAAMSDAGCSDVDDYRLGEFPDLRDYRAMADAVERSVVQNLSGAGAHREGYLRALTHLLALVADGCGPGEDWEPIGATAAAFVAPRAASAAILRAASREAGHG